MGKLAVSIFAVSILSILNEVVRFTTEVRVLLYIIGFLISTWFVFLDIYLFLVKPGEIGQKLIELFMVSAMGDLYERYKTDWSLKGLKIFCNPFTSETKYFDGYHYMVAVEKELINRTHDGDRKVCFDKRKFIQDKWKMFHFKMDRADEETDYHFKFFLNENKKTFYRYCTVESKSVFIEVRPKEELFEEYYDSCKGIDHEGIELDYNDEREGGSFRVEISNSGTDQILKVISGKCLKVRNIQGIFNIWGWYSKHPECGVIDMRRGGVHKGVKYLHAYNLESLHRGVSKDKLFLGRYQHEDHGFHVGFGFDIDEYKEVFNEVIEGETNSDFKFNFCLKKILECRFPRTSGEIIKNLSEKFLETKKLKALIGNWQSKRLWSDIKFLKNALGHKNRVCCDNIRPTKECLKVVREYLDVNSIQTSTPYAVSRNWAEDLQKPYSKILEFTKKIHSTMKTSRNLEKDYKKDTFNRVNTEERLFRSKEQIIKRSKTSRDRVDLYKPRVLSYLEILKKMDGPDKVKEIVKKNKKIDILEGFSQGKLISDVFREQKKLISQGVTKTITKDKLDNSVEVEFGYKKVSVKRKFNPKPFKTSEANEVLRKIKPTMEISNLFEVLADLEEMMDPKQSYRAFITEHRRVQEEMFKEKIKRKGFKSKILKKSFRLFRKFHGADVPVKKSESELTRMLMGYPEVSNVCSPLIVTLIDDDVENKVKREVEVEEECPKWIKLEKILDENFKNYIPNVLCLEDFLKESEAEKKELKKKELDEVRMQRKANKNLRKEKARVKPEKKIDISEMTALEYLTRMSMIRR
jgi:hypothetical protein